MKFLVLNSLLPLLSLIQTDRSLRKTAKSVLLSLLESDKVVERRLPARPEITVVHKIDGMALIQIAAGTILRRQFKLINGARLSLTMYLCSITSRCSGNEPALNKDRTRQRGGNRACYVLHFIIQPLKMLQIKKLK